MATISFKQFQRAASVCTVAIFFSMSAFPAAAQQPGRVITMKRFEAKGKIHSFTQTQLNVMINGNQPWALTLDKETKVEVTGPGEASMLRPGSLVRFYAYLDKRHIAVKPITEITALEPFKGFQPTLAEEPEPTPEKKEEAADEAADEASENEEEVEEEAVEEEPANKRRRRGRAMKEAPKRYFVNGIVKSNRRGKITIAIDRKTKVRIELAENAKITIDAKSLNFAKPGDNVHVTAYYQQQGTGLARQLKITRVAAPPKPEKKTKKPRRARRRKPKVEVEPAGTL